jgi:RNA-directed DNA polymerase
MSSYTKLVNGLETLGLMGIKSSLDNYIELINSGEKSVVDVSLHKPKPAYRTYIKKKNGKLRPLGIPTIKDRVYQNVVKLVLEP